MSPIGEQLRSWMQSLPGLLRGDSCDDVWLLAHRRFTEATGADVSMNDFQAAMVGGGHRPEQRNAPDGLYVKHVWVLPLPSEHGNAFPTRR